MATPAVANLDAGSNRMWERVLIAFALSVALHLAILLGIPVNPTGGVPSGTAIINARLEAGSETPAETAIEPPLRDVAPTVTQSETWDPLVDPATKRVEPKPEPEPAALAPASSPSAGIEIPLIRDPTYYLPMQLDIYPTAQVPIDCPAAASAQRINGKVRLLLLIDEFGVVNEASVIAAEPPGYFEEVTLAAFRAARFSPPQKQGRPVKVRAPVTVEFSCAKE